MSAAGRAPAEKQVLRVELPQRFRFLLDLHPYKVAYGGRNGLKSWSFADAILALGSSQQLRVVCCREVMKSLTDSCHKLLSDRIQALGLGGFYAVFENKIRGRNGTEIIYAGLSDQTDESIKSFEGADVCWVEEAQGVTDGSWSKLLPTIRKENSEVWVSFNPDLESDATYRRFVLNPPPGAVVVKSNYDYAQACGFMTDKQEALRLHDKSTMTVDEYENIWEGKPRLTVAGAIYSREVVQAITDGRIRPTPYDPRFPVHTVWDLGWNDAMSIIMVQKPAPSALNIINYMEDSFLTYAEFVRDLNALGYVWGTDWLPHDGENKDPKSGKSAKQVLQGLGRKSVRIIGRGDVESGIRTARMLFPRLYIDNTARARPKGFLGAERLVECLKNYKRNVPKSTGEPATPAHDQFSHGADAFRGLAVIVDQIHNDGDFELPRITPFKPSDASMGALG
ncbi:MAG: PBSX family phage terminase large subunit [Rhizomicrobium sp.]